MFSLLRPTRNALSRGFYFKNSNLFVSQICSEHTSIEIGQSASLHKTFNSDDVKKFAEITGDFNALHFDDNFAAKFKFSKAIVHGALINGVISATIGMILPGQGSILLYQDLHFPNPLYVDELFVSNVMIVNKKRNIYFCEYKCITENEKVVIEGMAKVLYQPSKISSK